MLKGAIFIVILMLITYALCPKPINRVIEALEGKLKRDYDSENKNFEEETHER